MTETGQSFEVSTLLSPRTAASGGFAHVELESSHGDFVGVIEPGASA